MGQTFPSVPFLLMSDLSQISSRIRYPNLYQFCPSVQLP